MGAGCDLLDYDDVLIFSNYKVSENAEKRRLLALFLHSIPAHSLDDSLAIAKKVIGKDDPEIAAIPDGVSVIVKC